MLGRVALIPIIRVVGEDKRNFVRIISKHAPRGPPSPIICSSSTMTNPRLSNVFVSIKEFTIVCAFSMVAIKTEYDPLRLTGGIRPRLPAYSSTQNPSSRPIGVSDRTFS
ncbi:unnamed protein product [Schistosoma margrebowiei]|uniref:Uncharacterized protein n=1 Tax=Schistosoma margrebowiei TaxID=48269 RepID=A0A183LHC8_9TREM|nr:unnamed protein product [Schistosoma margrebowiei]